MFEEIGAASVALSPHRLHESTQHLEMYGSFNAGFVYWRRDDTALRCLADWLHDCVNWCGEEPQADGRFMNQGYLNGWPDRYPGVHILRHPGVNLAPWNVDGTRLERRGDRLLTDGQPLIFYHYHGLGRASAGNWVGCVPYFREDAFVRQHIYEPYLFAVEAEISRLRRKYGLDGNGSVRRILEWPVSTRYHVGNRVKGLSTIVAGLGRMFGRR
jgi:hypothetical protein